MESKRIDDLPDILTVDDLTVFLGIGKNSAYDLVRSGKLRSIRIGRQIRITKDAVLAFLYGQQD